MAGDARIQKAGWKDLSFLGNGVDVEPRRHGVAVLEPHGFHAGGPAGHSHATATVQVRVSGEELLEQGEIVRITLLSIIVQDQAHALAFYRDKLGFVLKDDVPAGEYR